MPWRSSSVRRESLEGRNTQGTTTQREGSLLDALAGLCGSNRFSDLVFVVGEERKRIPVHRLLLAIRSPVLRELLYGGGTLNSAGRPCQTQADGCAVYEIVASDVDPSAFQCLLYYLYTDKVELAAETVMCTLYAAKKYGLEMFQAKCISFVRTCLSADLVGIFYAQALHFRESGIATACLDFISKNTGDVLSHGDLEHASVKCIRGILQLKTLGQGVREIDLFRMCIRWADQECTRQGGTSTAHARARLLRRLGITPLLRFPTMSLREVAEEVAPSGVLNERELVEVYTLLANPSAPCLSFCMDSRNGDNSVVSVPAVIPPAPPPKGSGKALKFLIAGADPASDGRECIVRDVIDSGADPLGVGTMDTVARTPTLADLLRFDAVLVYSNNAPADRTALGDTLAEYADAGGGLVVCAYATDNIEGPLGRWYREKFCPLHPGTGDRCAPHSLGHRVHTDHPVLKDIRTLNGGPKAYRTRCDPERGATVIALWDDGVPLVAERCGGRRGRLIALNMFPVSSTSYPDSWATGSDNARLLLNALTYVGKGR